MASTEAASTVSRKDTGERYRRSGSGIHDLTYRGGFGTPETRQNFLYWTHYGLWLGAGGPVAGGVMALTHRLFGLDAG